MRTPTYDDTHDEIRSFELALDETRLCRDDKISELEALEHRYCQARGLVERERLHRAVTRALIELEGLEKCLAAGEDVFQSLLEESGLQPGSLEPAVPLAACA